MRITQRYLKEWLQKEFQRLEVKLIVKEIHKTYCRPSEYEGGAAYFIIKVGTEGSSYDASIYVSYPLWYLQKELNNGYELCWKPRDYKWVMDSEIDIRKKQK